MTNDDVDRVVVLAGRMFYQVFERVSPASPPYHEPPGYKHFLNAWAPHARKVYEAGRRFVGELHEAGPDVADRFDTYMVTNFAKWLGYLVDHDHPHPSDAEVQEEIDRLASEFINRLSEQAQA